MAGRSNEDNVPLNWSTYRVPTAIRTVFLFTSWSDGDIQPNEERPRKRTTENNLISA